MGLFDSFRRRPKKRMIVDEMDDDPTLRYSDIGWKVASDEQDYDKLTNEYKHNGIARSVVATPAEDAVRNGWRLVIPDYPEKQQQYQEAMDKLKLPQELCKEVIYQRLHGDGYTTINVREASASTPDQPLDPSNILDISSIHAFGQNHIQQQQTNDDPTSDDYGKEQAIVIRPTNSGDSIDANGLETPNPTQAKPVVIDKSRYFHISLDKFEDDRTGTSILTRCQDQLKALDIALQTTGKILREFTFKAFKSDLMMAEGDADYARDKAEIGRVLNTESTVFLHNADSIEKLSTQTSGIDTLFSFAWQNLCAACKIPKSVLIGEQSGTLAGASQDVVNYYDRVKTIQTELLKPEIERIVSLLMYAQNVADGPEDPTSFDWHIEFNPLWSADDKTQSETTLNYANAASTLVSAGIKDPDEAGQMLAGQGNNNVAGMQTPQTQTDSADHDIKPEDIAAYEHDLKKAIHHGTKA